ncbi:hypothetical protein [Ekhidna sp.]
MKKILPFLLITVFYIVSCKDDDRLTEVLTGTWIGQRIDITNCSDDARNISEEVDCGDVSCFRLILNSNTYSFQQRTSVTEGTWSVGDVLSLCVEEENEIICDEYLFTLTGASLILSADTTSARCVTTFTFDKLFEQDTTSS